MLQMKPETIARRAAKRIADRAEARAIRRFRLAELAKKQPDGIWTELLEIEKEIEREARRTAQA